MQASTTALLTVDYGQASGDHAFQRVRIVREPLSASLDRLRAVIEDANLWVLHEVDPQMLLARGGFAILPARQLLFFHPRYVARLLAADPAALIEAPLKFVLTELPDGTVAIRWNDPALSFGRYGGPELRALGAELAQLCEAIVGSAVGAML